MKANFPACLAITLKYEGGYSDNPRDPGGPTCRGITQRVYDAYRHGPLGYRSVRYIAENEVQDIYRHQYWDAIRGDDLPAGVDLIAFDIAVNSGPGRATQWLAASAGYPPLERIYYLDSSRCSFWRQASVFRDVWPRVAES
jgi:lysozyme family protein